MDIWMKKYMWNNHKAMKFQYKNKKCTGWEKVLYGLKQASRAWYSRIDSYIIENGFHRSESDPTLYTKVNDQGNMLIVFLYVDDLRWVQAKEGHFSAC